MTEKHKCWVSLEIGFGDIEELQATIRRFNGAAGFVIPLSLVLRFGAGAIDAAIGPIVRENNNKIACGTIDGGYPAVLNTIEYLAPLRADAIIVGASCIGTELIERKNKLPNLIIDPGLENLHPSYCQALHGMPPDAKLLQIAGLAAASGFYGAMIPWKVIKENWYLWTGERTPIPGINKFISVVLESLNSSELQESNQQCGEHKMAQAVVIRWQGNFGIDNDEQMELISRYTGSLERF